MINRHFPKYLDVKNSKVLVPVMMKSHLSTTSSISAISLIDQHDDSSCDVNVLNLEARTLSSDHDSHLSYLSVLEITRISVSITILIIMIMKCQVIMITVIPLFNGSSVTVLDALAGYSAWFTEFPAISKSAPYTESKQNTPAFSK